MSTNRLPSAWHRDIDRLLKQIGYTLDENHGRTHLVYRHQDIPGVFTVACSPGDVTAEVNLLTQLRRRHPGHPALIRRGRTQPAAERKRRRRRRRPERVVLLHEVSDGTIETFERPDRTGCIVCGRRWLSDLDPTNRPCPDCGGEVVYGRLEEAA